MNVTSLLGNPILVRQVYLSIHSAIPNFTFKFRTSKNLSLLKVLSLICVRLELEMSRRRRCGRAGKVKRPRLWRGFPRSRAVNEPSWSSQCPQSIQQGEGPSSSKILRALWNIAKVRWQIYLGATASATWCCRRMFLVPGSQAGRAPLNSTGHWKQNFK